MRPIPDVDCRLLSGSATSSRCNAEIIFAYAVPRVIAAADPPGNAAVQARTLVKLARMLMQGPVMAGLWLLMPARTDKGRAARDNGVLRLMPPFIIAFLVLAMLNSLSSIPAMLAAAAHGASGLLTVLAMAGLCLGCRPAQRGGGGPRVTLVVALSLLTLGGRAFNLLYLFHLS